MSYGMELILDLENVGRTMGRESITLYMEELCKWLSFKREDLHFWDYKGDPKAYEAALDHLKGTSAVQFIKTSTIIIHSLDVTNEVYINIFSCGNFDYLQAIEITKHFFNAEVKHYAVIQRG